MYKIEKGIPMPTKAQSPITKALHALEVGDSFLVTGKKSTQIATYIRKVKRSTNRKFAWRAVENGIRIWRTA
jgi:uncharacterized protein (DUF2249 family)